MLEQIENKIAILSEKINKEISSEVINFDKLNKFKNDINELNKLKEGLEPKKETTTPTDKKKIVNTELLSKEEIIKKVEGLGYYYVIESTGGVIYKFNEHNSEWTVFVKESIIELFKNNRINAIRYDKRKSNDDGEIYKENLMKEYIRVKVPYNGSVCDFSNKTHNNVLNIANKPKLKIVEGNINPYLDLIDCMFTDEEESTKNNFLDFIAHMFQYPEQRPIVAWVIKGGMGSYKNYMLKIVLDILKGATYETSNLQDLLNSNFNSYLDGKLLIVADEIHWGGDKKSESSLKDFITKKNIWVERKRFEKYNRYFVARLIMTTNEEYTTSATLEERRTNTISVNPKLTLSYRRENPDSEEAIVGRKFEDWMNEDKEVLNKIYNYFLLREIDLSKINEINKTKELKKQKKLHLGSFNLWLEDAFENGCFYNTLASNHIEVGEDNIKLSSSFLKQSYFDFLLNNNIQYTKLDGVSLIKRFKEIFKTSSIEFKKVKVNNHSFNGVYIHYNIKELEVEYNRILS